ncbi:MAG TPA: VCBS repeat-containing protein [Solimonas sp.]|nr:VCBS repeat-containing protein [Solimonas sp.]
MSTVASAAITFAPAVSYSTGSPGGPGPAAESMVAVDLDNDGDADVVAADWWSTGIRTFKNNGNGTFGAAIVTNLGAYTGTGSVSAADFNGDGKADVAVTTGSEIIILRGLGNGSFSETERHAHTPSGQMQAYTFETNNDGRVDIVAPTGSGVQTFLGLGNGRFVKGPLTPVTGLMSATAKANFNNDGIADIALADAAGMQAILLRGNGDGSFTQFASSTLGLGPEDLTAGDLNGDGIDDLASADSFSFTMSVLLSNGQGGFDAATRYVGVAGPVSLRMADFDRDGDRDIVVSSVMTPGVQVYTNDGSGGFGTLPMQVQTTFEPQTPAIADYNRDGKLDFAVAGPAQMSILINTSP